MRNGKVKSIIFLTIAIIALIAVSSVVFVKNTIFVNKNQNVLELASDNTNYRGVIKTKNGEFSLEATDIIKKSSELLGKSYSQNDDYGKGINVNYGTRIVSKDNVKSAQNINSIDCSGLIYWTLSSIAKDKGIEYGTTTNSTINNTVSNISSGFLANNPVPPNTYNWLMYQPSQYYFSETGWSGSQFSSSVNDVDLKIYGKSVNVLKANQIIRDGLEYYQYIDSNGDIKELPAGTIVIVNNLKMDSNNPNRNGIDDHSWICIGNLGTTDASVAREKLIAMGISADKLIIGETIISESNTNTYWRIESKGGKGVYINNNDARQSTTYREIVDGREVVKSVGPIWAFQVANDYGQYKISVEKVDENGKAIPLSKNIFEVKVNENNLNGNISNTESNKVEFETQYFSSSDLTDSKKQIDTVSIKETEAPNSNYAPYEKTIRLKIKKVRNTKLQGEPIELSILDQNGNIIKTYSQSQLQSGNFNYDDGNVRMDFSNGNIAIKIKNNKINGTYNLNIIKTDSTGKTKQGATFTAQTATRVNGVLEDTWKTISLTQTSGLFTAQPFEITETNKTDVIQITEENSPAGYEKIDKKIILQINKKQQNNQYIIDTVAISVLDKNVQVNENTIGNGTVILNASNGVFIDSSNHIKIELSGNSSINVTVENRTVDLALKKTITKVNGKQVKQNNGFNTSRFLEDNSISQSELDSNYVDISSLNDTTNAKYFMNKTPISVNVNDEIEYSIKIFNEGEVKAKASKISDYIPKGLTVTNVLYHGSPIEFSVVRGVLGIELESDDNYINEFNGKTLSFDEIIVKCKVDNDATGILTNVAEITEYKTQTGIIYKDIDSIAGNWSAPGEEIKLLNEKSSEAWRNYGNNSQITSWSFDNLVQDNGTNGNKGDDDDFDKVIVNSIDLALKKVITQVVTLDDSGKVTNTQQISRPNINDYSWVNPEPLNENKTDALYNMNKTPISLYRGNEVTYRLYVFNEGNTSAKALDVTDYIPVGLQVKDVYYKDNLSMINIPSSEIETQSVIEENANKNYFSYLKNDGVLYIHLGDETATEIPAYNGANLEKDFVTVKCIVLDDAQGILTNMAEISTYSTNGTTVKTDVDSISNNWKSPTGEIKKLADKAKTQWRNYVKGTGKLDNNYHQTFTGSKYDETNGQEDDDDFEKVKVLNTYKIAVTKISGHDENQPIEGIGFEVKYKDEQSQIKYTDSQGKIETAEKVVNYTINSDEEDVFYLKEDSVPENINYSKLEEEFELRIVKERTSLGEDVITRYAFVLAGTHTGKTKSLTEETELVVNDKNGIPVYVRAKYDYNTNTFIITIPNNAKRKDYELQLIKVKNKENENDEDEPISEIEFLNSVEISSAITNQEGKISYGPYSMDLSTYMNDDEYIIREIGGIEHKYYNLKKPISVKVRKGFDNGNANFYVDKISLNDSEFTDGPITQEVELRNTNKKVKITLSVEGNLITLKIPNIELEGKYSLEVIKMDENSDILEDKQAGFSLTDESEEKLTVNGRVKLVDEKTITSDQLGENNKDVYTISEVTAPEGFVKLAKPIVVEVYKEDNGQNYAVSKVKAYTENSSEVTVMANKFGFLANVKLVDGRDVDVLISLQKSDIIEVYVPNKELEGKYNLEVYKYSMENGTETALKDIDFSIVKTGELKASTRKTDSNGIAHFNGIKITEPSVDTYELKEGKLGSDTKYIGIADTIKFTTVTGENADGSRFELLDANFENNTKQTRATLTNGKTVILNLEVNKNTNGINVIKINVENPLITGRYKLNLAKTVEKDLLDPEYLDGVTFNVKENGAENSVPYQTVNGGKVKIADKIITYNDVNTPDEYYIEEIGFEKVNQYVKLKNPLTIKIEKGKNTNGEEGTENAPGTKFVINKIKLIGKNRGLTKSITHIISSNEETITLTDVELEDGTLVDIVAKLSEEIDNLSGEKVQVVEVTIPNTERKGSYEVELRKVDSKGNNISYAEFNVKSTVNGEEEQTLIIRTNDGYSNVKSVVLDAETLDTVDTFKFDEINVYNSLDENVPVIGYAKLSSPITLSVTKKAIEGSFTVSTMTLSQGENEATSASGKVTLEACSLEYGKRADVTAELKDNKITVTIPNTEITGEYSLSLFKTTNDFNNVKKDSVFRYTGNDIGEKTDENGEIKIVDSYVIDNSNWSTVDNYTITEVEDKSDIYLEIKEPINITVEKQKADDEFVVSKVTMSVGEQSKSVYPQTTNIAQIDGIKTVNSNRTASAKILLDGNDISVSVDNPKIDGEYGVKIKKVDSENGSTVIPGVTFKATLNKKLTTGGAYTNISTNNYTTQTDGFAYIAGDNPFTTNVVEEKAHISAFGPENWYIEEISASESYQLLENVKIKLIVNKKISEDGKKFVIDANSVKIEIIRDNNDDETIKLQEKLKGAVKAYVNEEGTEVTVVIPNDKLVDYNFKIMKKDMDGNPLPGAIFSVVDPNNDDILFYDEIAGDSAEFVKSYSKVKPNETYKFIVTEDESVETYRNLLDKLNLEVSVKLDEQGIIDINNCKIEIIPQSNDYDLDEYIKLEELIESGDIALSIEPNNTICLKIVNEKITTDYSLRLLKTEMDYTSSISGAQFKVLKNNADFKEFTSVKVNSTEIDNSSSVNANTEILYEIEEINAPVNYDKLINKIRVLVKVDENGEVTAKITEVLPLGANPTWQEYTTEQYGDIVKITKAYNEFSIKWNNDSHFVFLLYKEGFEKTVSMPVFKSSYVVGQNNVAGLPLLDSTSGLKMSIKQGNNSAQEISGTPYQDVLRSVKANSEYEYTFSEIQPATGYNNDFDGVEFKVHIRTDDNANLIESDQQRKEQCSYYEIIDLNENNANRKSGAQLAEMASKVALTVDNERKEVKFFMVDTKESQNGTYRLNLYKQDEITRKSLSGAEFEITFDDGTTTEFLDSDPDTYGIQNFTTDENGMIRLPEITFNTLSSEQQIHTFEIRETVPPVGYTGLGTDKLIVKVDLTNKLNSSQITTDDVEVSMQSGAQCNVKKVMYVGGNILLTIPNEGNNFKVTLKKKDTNGNLIDSSYYNGEKQGSKISFVSSANNAKILDGNEFFDDGDVTYTHTITNNEITSYNYLIREVESKYGYKNIFKDYFIILIVKIDQYGNVINVNPDDITDENMTHINIVRIGTTTGVTPEEVKNALTLSVNTDSDGLKNIEVDLINPNEYKLRLRKTDTAGNPIDKAIVTANIIGENNSETEKARLNNTSEETTDYITINQGETQNWVVSEIEVDKPYLNILSGNRKLYISARASDQRIICSYEIRDVINGEEVTLERYDYPELYNLIKVNVKREEQGNVIDVQIKNPSGYDFSVYKADIHNTAITASVIKVNEVTTFDGTNNNSNVTFNERNLKIGDEKEYTISEISSQDPYINILGNDKLFIKVKVVAPDEVAVSGYGYIETVDGNEIVHNGTFGPYDEYVTLPKKFGINNITKLPTLVVYLRNPIQYKIRVYKTDENNNAIKNADFEVIDQDGELHRNENSEYIEFSKIASNRNVTKYVKIIENESASGYNNDLKNKEFYFKAEYTTDIGSAQNPRMYVGFPYMKDSLTGELTFDSEILAKYFTYSVIKEDNIPVIVLKMKNTTDYNLNIIKQTTSEIDYNGAKLELFKYNEETHEIESIAKNYNGEDKSSRISLSEISVEPNKTQRYYIKEISTEAPHVNILENKMIGLDVELKKNEQTGELSLNYDYKILDDSYTELTNDSAEQFIRLNVTKDENTGKYTLNVYIENPIQVKMKFRKTDMSGNVVLNKSTIEINDELNNGTREKTYNNLKIGSTLTFSFKEYNTSAPFVNVLPNGSAINVVARVMENEKLSIVSANYIDNSTGEPVIRKITDIKEYFSINITEEDGIETLNMDLRNPVQYTVKLLKQDMAGLGLSGSDIQVIYNDEIFTNNGQDFIEIPIKNQKPGDIATLRITEKSAKQNYKNIFGSNNIIEVQFKLKDDYTLTNIERILEIHTVGKVPIVRVPVPGQYFDVKIDNMVENPSKITGYIIMKNPIEYNIEFVKTDLSNNEISGDGLNLQVTKNSEAPVSNNGDSTIKFEERNLAPNTTNTYVLEELSTIAPYYNKLKDKKVTVSVTVDENGNITTSTPVISDEYGRTYENDLITVEPNLEEEGRRTIKVVVQNPIKYSFKLVKTTTPNQIYGEEDEPTLKPINGASLSVTDTQYGEILNDSGNNEINLTYNNINVGQIKTFIIKENSKPSPYENLLENKEIVLVTAMGLDRKLHFLSEFVRDSNIGGSETITPEVKEKYRFDYQIVTDENGYETLEVNLQNPITFNVKVVKKDASGVNELPGAEIVLEKDNEIIATNKDTSSATLEYTQHNVGSNDRYVFRIMENSSVSPNQNILQGKSLLMPVIYSDGNLVQYNIWLIDNSTGEISPAGDFVKLTRTKTDGINTFEIEISNPTDFDLDLVKNSAGVGFLQNTKFIAYREDAEEPVFDGYVTDINTWKTSEIQEHNLKAGRYTYYITETKTARQRYINELEGKYIKINVQVSGTGEVTIMNNNWEQVDNYYEIYEGDVSNRKSTDTLVPRINSIYNNVNVNVLVNNQTRKNTIQCNVTNTLKYTVELQKVDSAGESEQGAEFEIRSSVIDSQNAEKTEIDKTVGVSDVTEDGYVTGITNDKGKISFEETNVSSGIFEYEFRETETPGRQYVNPVEGYTVHFKVEVEENGDLKLVSYDNGKKLFIEKQGVEAPEDLYKYILLEIQNNTVVAKLQIQVENPVKYKVVLYKSIYGTENISLKNAEFKIESSIVKAQQAVYRQLSSEKGITDITEKGIISAKTDEKGYISFDETMVKAGIYEYWITETRTGNDYIVNPLKNKYIKIYVKVDSDGTIHTLSDDGQIIDGKYYLYENDKQTLINFEESSLDELINISVNNENEVNILNINIANPESYDLNLVKLDADTQDEMDNVKFEVKTYEQGSNGEKVPVKIKCAEDITKDYDTSEFITSEVNGTHGFISINKILFEKCGTYYFEFIEKTPKNSIIYKDKVENVIVKVNVGVKEINGQRLYVVESEQIVQGENYVISHSSVNNSVGVNVSNERVKGSYSIEIEKLEELLGGPVKGAKFEIKALKENTEFGVEDEISLYKSTNDVNSMEAILPMEFTIDSDDGKFIIENIRIDKPEEYVIEIKETQAPEKYTLLKDVIRLKIVTGVQGEGDEAKYVLKSVELDGNDNNGLVKVSNTNEKITIKATNNQFDLSLRKFISSINGEDVTRWTQPEVDTSKLVSGEETTAKYFNNKAPLRVYAGQDIIYTIRVYNEGQIAGYANNIVDHLPEQLEFLEDDEFNKQRRWSYVEGDESKRTIETDYLSSYVGKETNLIKPLDSKTGELSYVEVQVKCRIKENAKAGTYITNIAEIAEYEGKDRPDAIDRDSKANNVKVPYTSEQEDDDDFEKVFVNEFDLALRKFITKVNDKAVTSRVPAFKVDENGKYVYEHDKTPVVVAHDNTVEYTIRIFNEGNVSGYANIVKDNIPEGLEFVPEDETNKKFGWVMLDKDGKETTDVSKAKFVVTDYLSMENGDKEAKDNPNLIKAFDLETMEEPDYKDIKVVFKVNVPVRRDDIIENDAQISDDKDYLGEDVLDIDSTPDKWIEGEDDQDREYIKVKYFDLALYKWVATTIVTQDGQTTEYESKHTQSDKSNMVNVTISKTKVNDITVKFRYIIKVENQGNLPGYAKEIKDHIPDGLEFVEEDNADYGWVLNDDGTIVTDYLKDTLLNENETAEVPVVLTWINGSDNLGQKFNYAEISKDYNDYGASDVDSKTDNFDKTPNEDDEDGDVVMLQIKTGSGIPYYVLVVLTAMMIIVAGVFGIKKFVVNKE